MGLFKRVKESEDDGLTDVEKKALLEKATEDFKLDPEKAITGEDLVELMNRLVHEAGLDDQIGFLLFERQEFDVLVQTPDLLVICRPPDPTRGISMPMVESLYRELKRVREERTDKDKAPESEGEG